MKKKMVFWALALVAAVAVVLGIIAGHSDGAGKADSPSNVSDSPARTLDKPGSKVPTAGTRRNPPRVPSTKTAGKKVTPPSAVRQGHEEDSQPPTEAEQRQREEETLVEAFDALTDKWMGTPADGKSVTMEDVRQFAEQFRKVPKSRKDECLHRALNLIPDENVMLLAGILMDKTLDREILQTVFSDVLNRDENVKKPILRQIFKDREHPCWADTAWILDVTGELPAKNQATGKLK